MKELSFQPIGNCEAWSGIAPGPPDRERMMRLFQWSIALVLAAAGACHAAATEDGANRKADLSTETAPAALSADPCTSRDIAANATRPTWDNSAATTLCGAFEIDSGWMDQPMGGGVRQTMWMSSVRYGLTPKLDLRWGLADYILQSGGGTKPLQGIGDDWLSVRFRFHDQGRRMPAMALSYGIKIPAANPAKGFGSGFVDSQFLFIASRDLGRNHFDFNLVGTEVGEARGHDGAAQAGMVITRPLTRKLSASIEGYGGPQPATSSRFGAGLLGAEYVMHPWLVLDCAYSRTFTAGAPRQQILFGFTYATRPGIAPIPKRSSIARLLGR